MPKNLAKVWIGLDWGTHSSKWWYTAEKADGKLLPATKGTAVIDSTIYRAGQKLNLAREGVAVKSDCQDRRLKRLLLNDPQGADYWEAVRAGIGISLGEAATFSLAVLLKDVVADLTSHDFAISGDTKVEIRYSLPNWIGTDATHQAARKRVYQTAALLSVMVAERGLNNLPNVGEEREIGDWRKLIEETRQSTPCKNLFESAPQDFGSMIRASFSLPNDTRISWRLVVESTAAGFPQLEQFLIPLEQARKTEDHWVKLLVVDVGAGSTDAGYFISSRRSNGKLLLNYLKPAATFDYAGERLTEMLQKFYLRRKNREITTQEAETLKLSAPDEWKDEQFVSDWRNQIADYVGDYMRYVPDHRRLGESAMPGLNIVMTGGSGLVEGLDRAVRNAVVEAMVRREIPNPVANRTQITELTLDWPQDRFDRARRAVSIGSGSSTLAQLEYIEQLEKTERIVTKTERW